MKEYSGLGGLVGLNASGFLGKTFYIFVFKVFCIHLIGKSIFDYKRFCSFLTQRII